MWGKAREKICVGSGESDAGSSPNQPGEQGRVTDLGALGEFGLIARLTAGLESRPDVILGVGDDAAVLALFTSPMLPTHPSVGQSDIVSQANEQSGAKHAAVSSPDDAALAPVAPLLLATCDAQVEGLHFLPWLSTPEEIGYKALAVNLSDIAAMGGEPLWALVSLLTPPTLDVALLDGVYAGLRALASRHHVAIVGGNIAGTTGPFTIDITLLGRAAPGALITRAGGRPGDALIVVGMLGAAAAGLLAHVTLAGVAPDAGPDAAALAAALTEARRAMVAPEPHVAAGRALAGLASAGLDVSDGFAGDLGHLCERSGVGALVEAALLPIAPAARRIALTYGRDPVALALYGGDDYALLCAVRPDRLAQAQAAVAAAGDTATVVGWLTERSAGMRLLTVDGQRQPLIARGWDHLRAEDVDTTR